MGEARRRGSFNERSKSAIQRSKAKLISLMGQRDERDDSVLRAGIAPFIARLSANEWSLRRAKILEALKSVDNGTELETAKPIRVQEDEIIWYLFLCQQALDDPLCMDVNQVARAAPFFSGIGARWAYSCNVKGLEKKIDDVLYKYRKEPDGLIFEILVALAYAEAGWMVEFLDEQRSAKSPDMRVFMNGIELYIECKRLARRTSYAEQERNEFLRLWDGAKHVLLQQNQCVWFKGNFHVEVTTLPKNFLAEIFAKALPIAAGEVLIYDGLEATIHARVIDMKLVHLHLARWRVKTNSPMLNKLLGGDWAPLNSSTSIIKIATVSQIVDCEVPVLGGYIDEINWACGFTRDFDSEISLSKKAKDVTKHLADAVKQVPADKPSVIHIAAETLEGKHVERLRTRRVMESIPAFVSGKLVLGVRFHRFQANQTIDKLWEFDETVEQFQIEGPPLNDIIPLTVVVPKATLLRKGSHWNIYQ